MKTLATVLVLLLLLSLQALALDPRCEDPRFKDRPICQSMTTTTSSTTTTEPSSTTTVTDPTTTSTLGTTTTTSEPPPLSAGIAGLGCSNTFDALADPGGYLDQSAEDNLIVVAAGGHTISNWADGRSWNSRYIGFRPATGYTGLWIHLCERAGAGLDVNDVVTIITNARALDPGIPVWLSPMNTYDGVFCPVTGGNEISEQGEQVVAELTSSMTGVVAGPDLGPLTSDMVRRDDCHPNSQGVALMGAQLVEFFDAG